MAYGTKWTEEEDKILCEFYPIEHGAVAERLPGRSVGSCRARASILGIAQKMDVKPDMWSDNEVKILFEFYPSEGGNVVRRLPGRTVAACRIKARALGIICSESLWTDEELAILSEHFPTEGQLVSERLPGRSSSACCSKAHALNIQLGEGRKRRSRKNGNKKK